MSTADSSSKPSQDPQSPAMGAVAARGMAWTTLAVFVGRLTGFLGHLVLGWLLSEDDFGIYAIAISLSVVVLTVRTSGLQKLLVQRGDEFNELAQPAARLSFLANVIGLVVLLVLAPFGAAFYKTPALVPLISIIALSLPLSVPAEIIRARMSVELKFRDLAFVNAVSMVTSQTMVVALAWAGMGPYSFVIPMATVAGLESIALLLWLGWWPQGRRLDRSLVVQFLQAVKWIYPCGFAGAFIVLGTNLVVGRLESRVVTGLFYFGFQLTTSLAVFFNAGMQRVLMPVMSRMGEQVQRQGQAYLKCVRLLVSVASPLCLLGVVVARPLTHLLWQGKWDAAVPVVALLGCALPIYLMTGVGAAALESRGLWRDNTLLHVASALGTLAAAWIGATQGGLVAIALCAAIFRLCFGLAHGSVVAVRLDQKRRAYLSSVVPPYVVSLCCAATVYYCSSRWLFPKTVSPIVEVAALSVAYLVLIAFSFSVLLRANLNEIWSMARLGGRRKG